MMLIEIVSKMVLYPVQSMPHHEPASNSDGLLELLIVILIGVLLIIAFVVTFFLYKYLRGRQINDNRYLSSRNINNQHMEAGKTEYVSQSRSSHREILSLKENAVIDLLLENQGNLLQKKLPDLTNYSKSTITRILLRLEEQDIVYRSPAGRGYRVFLKKVESI